MKNSKGILIAAVCVFCLSLAACFFTALYGKNSSGDGIFALSFNDKTTVFSKKDMDFLRAGNYYFTFEARQEAEAFTETARARIEVVGTNADFVPVTGMKAISGSFFNDIHGKKLSNMLALNSAAAWHFFGNTDCIGNSISINGKEHQVAGVFESSFENRDNMRIFLPFEVMEKEIPESYIYEILIMSENISATELLITAMGYSPEDFLVFDLEQYKNIMMQRARIIVFLSGLYVIARLARMCLFSIRAIIDAAKLFGKRNYVADVRLLLKDKMVLFELLLLAVKLLLILMLVNIIKFKLYLPYYFFSMKGLNYSAFVELLSFFIQPYTSVPALGYLNSLNLVSNVMFLMSLLSGTVVLCVLSFEQKKDRANLPRPVVTLRLFPRLPFQRKGAN